MKIYDDDDPRQVHWSIVIELVIAMIFIQNVNLFSLTIH